MIVAACNGGGAATTDRGAAPPSSSTVTDGTDERCDAYAALQQAGELNADVIADAPGELREPLNVLDSAADVDPEALSAAALGRVVRAQAAIASWAHAHCGGDHPFCAVWVTVEGVIAASAFADATQDGNTDDTSSFVAEIDDVLAEHVPAELRGALRRFLDWFDPGRSTSPMSDEDERASEQAVNALEQWSWAQRCPGATPPDDH